MTQPGLDNLGITAGGDEQSSEVVSPVVVAEARREAFNLAAGFSHRALNRPRGQLALVLTRQQSLVPAVSGYLN